VTATVLTKAGPVTSYRVLSLDATGRPIYVWRCDNGEQPRKFASVADAQEWVDVVFAGSSSKERAEAGWRIEEDVT